MKILDFGIMKAKQRVSHTDSGTVRGTSASCRPSRRAAASSITDPICSRPVLVLHVATGELTYPGDTF